MFLHLLVAWQTTECQAIKQRDGKYIQNCRECLNTSVGNANYYTCAVFNVRAWHGCHSETECGLTINCEWMARTMMKQELRSNYRLQVVKSAAANTTELERQAFLRGIQSEDKEVCFEDITDGMQAEEPANEYV